MIRMPSIARKPASHRAPRVCSCSWIRSKPIDVEILQRRCQADRFDDRWGTGFKLFGQFMRGETVNGDLRDHPATAEEGRHRFEDCFLAVQHTDPGRAAYFMAAEDDEVGVPRLDIDPVVRCRLGRVDENGCSGIVSHFGPTRDGVLRPQRVAGRTEGEQFGLVLIEMLRRWLRQ